MAERASSAPQCVSIRRRKCGTTSMAASCSTSCGNCLDQNRTTRWSVAMLRTTRLSITGLGLALLLCQPAAAAPRENEGRYRFAFNSQSFEPELIHTHGSPERPTSSDLVDVFGNLM